MRGSPLTFLQRDEPVGLDWIPEPLVQFRHGQCVEDPRDGLALFGPLESPPVDGVRVGVVGTPLGLSLYKAWAERLTHALVPDIDDVRRVAFPGFEAVFQATWRPKPSIEIAIPDAALKRALYLDDRPLRVARTARLYTDRILEAEQNADIPVDVWFVVAPEEVYKYCRPLSPMAEASKRVASGVRVSSEQARSLLDGSFLFPEIVAAEIEAAQAMEYDSDFRRQIKLRLLGRRVVSQLVLESTLRGHGYGRPARSVLERGIFEANAAWRLGTAAYFKAGGRPWRSADVRPGVCYLGLTFRRLSGPRDDGRSACCAAQMFLDSGDGLVFKGAVGPWYSTGSGQFHLDRKSARDLVAKAVHAYRLEDPEGRAPDELFVHGRTRFQSEEWAGVVEGAGDETTVTGVKIWERTSTRVYRTERFPVIRGTVLRSGERDALLWTKGYVPRLQTLTGLEVPKPLHIEVVRGDTPIETVLRDVMALTKLNYNSVDFADGQPVTLRFADRVGEILTAGPEVPDAPLPFRLYV